MREGCRCARTKRTTESILQDFPQLRLAEPHNRLLHKANIIPQAFIEVCESKGRKVSFCFENITHHSPDSRSILPIFLSASLDAALDYITPQLPWISIWCSIASTAPIHLALDSVDCLDLNSDRSLTVLLYYYFTNHRLWNHPVCDSHDSYELFDSDELERSSIVRVLKYWHSWWWWVVNKNASP